MIGVSVLGATGSIGLSTLDVLARHPDSYRVVALTANRDVAGMAKLCRQFRPVLAAMADEDSAAELRRELASDQPAIEVFVNCAGDHADCFPLRSRLLFLEGPSGFQDQGTKDHCRYGFG